MKPVFSILILFNLSFAQSYKMKPLNELINKTEPGWELVKQWMKDGKNHVEVLPKDSARADSALFQAQVTTRSPMGAVVYETGGILVDHGWIRILGSGCTRLNRGLMEWNKGKSFTKTGERISFLLVADDVLGGFFAINAGGIDSTGIGKIFYFAPDNLKWEPTDKSYSDFLSFCFCGDLDKYYEGYRWTNWKTDIENLDGTKGISMIPFLWSKEGQEDVNKNSRKAVPIQELWDLHFK